MMLKRIYNYLRTLDDTERSKLFVYTFLIVTIIFGSISYLSYKSYKKSENLYLVRLNSYKEIKQLVAEAEILQKKRPKVDSIAVQKVISESGISKFHIASNTVTLYNKTGYELELDQIPSDMVIIFLNTLHQRHIYLLKYEMKRLPTTGNYNVKLVLY